VKSHVLALLLCGATLGAQSAPTDTPVVIRVDAAALPGAAPAPPGATVVSIAGDAFHINGQPTLKGRTWRGHRVEGLLPNSRMVQGVFDDLNPDTRSRWAYPDTKTWDAARNTREFVAAMPAWRQRGLLAFTLNLQGGSPEGYSKGQPWHNSAFDVDGSLRPDYAARLTQILDEADRLGMAIILGLFYFGQDERLRDEAAIVRAVDETAAWILSRGYRNVVIEIDNECDIASYNHEILKPARVAELIRRVARTTVAGRRLLVSTSFRGNRVPTAEVILASDFVLLHGNGVTDPNRIVEMVNDTRKTPGYTPKPIVFNEDDHYDFEKPLNNFVAATSAYASWGFFDFRRTDEAFDQGYQSVPVNWGISSVRKQAFFDIVASLSNGPVLDPRSLTTDLPFPMAAVALPRIPDRTCRVTDHGARGDATTLNTTAIAAAIDACSKAGGGQVVVPRGVFLTGPIELKSRIDLHLERGALLLFSTRFEDYPLVRTSYEGGATVKATSPIWAKDAEDIAITGEGVIDGSGQAWRPVKKFKMTENQWKALLASGGVVDASGANWWPSREAMNGAETVKALDARGGEAPTEAAEGAAAARPAMPVNEGTPQFRDITISRILCRGAGRAVMLEGLPEMAIRGIVLEDSRMSATRGLATVDAENITLRRVAITAETGPAISVRSSRNVTVDGVPYGAASRK
jgi:hypothetical protein